MVLLALDIGNTFIKAGIFEDDILRQTHFQLTTDDLYSLLHTLSYQRAIVSAVRPVPVAIAQIMDKLPVIYLNADTSLPFTIDYETPHTLGADRIAAVAGAQGLYPDTNVLSVDIGTCITYDLISSHRQFCGGGIAPGLQMRLQAMHTFTARLPLITGNEIKEDHISLLGKNTRDCMISGAVCGMRAEIAEMIRMYADKFADLQVIISGGNASFFTKTIKQKHRLVPELILMGLNRILIYNVI